MIGGGRTGQRAAHGPYDIGVRAAVLLQGVAEQFQGGPVLDEQAQARFGAAGGELQDGGQEVGQLAAALLPACRAPTCPTK
ncbi:hypothetical protein [Streptomyces sp. NPDC001205]